MFDGILPFISACQQKAWAWFISKGTKVRNESFSTTVFRLYSLMVKKPEQHKHCSKFINHYLIKIKHKCRRCIQLTNEELDVVEWQIGQNKLINTGYYLKSCAVVMIGFHVDDHECLQAYADMKYPEFGGCVSVTVPLGGK